jgi:hypothetical protein
MGVAGATLAVGAAGIGASAISGSNSSSAAQKAAAEQAAADRGAAGQQYQGLAQTAGVLTPYTNEGQTAASALSAGQTSDQTGTNYIGQSQNYLGSANAAYGTAENALDTATGYNQDAANIYGETQGGISQQVLDNTPGYQFTLGQGLESTQNSAAARGLANSGAALKGAATYATGLANDTYQSQYNDLLSTAQGYSGLANNSLGAASGFNQTGSGLTGEAGTSLNQQASLLDTNNQNYNQLLQGAQLGENAANAYGEYASNAAQSAGADVSGAGAATASGTVGAANAFNNALTGSAGSLTQSLLLNNLLGGSGSGSLLGGSSGFTGSGASLAGNTGFVTLPGQ